MVEPSVLIGIPISNSKLYCFEELIYALDLISYKNREILLIETDGNDYLQGLIRGFEFNCETLNSKKKMMDKLVDARNFIRKYALDNNFDYVLFNDADCIPKENVIDKLLSHNKDFVSATCFGMDKQGNPELVARNLENNPVSIEDIGTGLIAISISGMGCVLLSNKILKEIEFRCERDSSGNLLISEDYCFSKDAIEKGYNVFLDTDIQIKHIMSGDWDFRTA